MLNKSILTAAAIALVVGGGSASAGEQLDVLKGFESLSKVSAVPMSSAVLDEVRGADWVILVDGTTVVRIDSISSLTNAVSNVHGALKIEPGLGILGVSSCSPTHCSPDHHGG